MNLKAFLALLKATWTEWNEDKASRLAAALAYYTVFSLAPLLIIVIAIAGLVFGHDAAQGRIVEQIEGLVGGDGADAIQAMLENANQPAAGVTATVIGVVTLLFGATGVFIQLQDALNTIWEVAPKPGQGIVNFLRNRFLSFSMVLGIGFLLLVSLVLSAVLAAIGTYFNHLLPGLTSLWQAINFVVSFGVITLLFGMIYRILPDVKIAWGDVWIGAAVTSLLFTIGRLLIGIYLGSSAIDSAYGAAGSFVVILVWVYYSAQILLFGAEFTQVYAKQYGSRIRPASNAIPATDEALAKQGMPRKQDLERIAQYTEAQRSEKDKLNSANRPSQTTNSQLAEHSVADNQLEQAGQKNYAAIALGSLLAAFGIMRSLTGSKRGRSGRR